jgi:uncharacterized protein YjbI with pentapeptide repeats
MGGSRSQAMANPKHLAKLQEGVPAWNEFMYQRAIGHLQRQLKRSPEVADLGNMNRILAGIGPAEMDEEDRDYLLHSANLVSADLRGKFLQGIYFEHVDLSGADLENAVVSWGRLRYALLVGANLREAHLSEADLFEANLMEANLQGADLILSNLTGADLTGSDWNEAQIDATIFGRNDLSRVKGLETVRHRGPSIIGIDTIYRSKGKIPESFLRGCGVPDEFITYAKSLIAHPIQFYSCFISYSTKDQAFADRLYADLQNKGVRCWFAPHDAQGGKKLHEQIDEAIRLHDKLLLILSRHSMENEWVKTEIAKARKREVRDQRRVLFPIRVAPFENLRDWECFDADTGKDSAREIREYFIPDFSNWKNHDSYQEAFQRLISDLKASDSKPR